MTIFTTLRFFNNHAADHWARANGFVFNTLDRVYWKHGASDFPFPGRRQWVLFDTTLPEARDKAGEAGMEFIKEFDFTNTKAWEGVESVQALVGKHGYVLATGSCE